MPRLGNGVGTVVVALGLLATGAPAEAQKYGGTLKALLTDNPPSLSIHQEGVWLTSFPMSPVFNNLVTYDPLQTQESLATIVPDLAESWQSTDGNTALVLKLRQGVKFHDGKPFTSRDVKVTFDIVRGKAASERLRLNPRKIWYFNVEDIVTKGDHEVVFKLKRPQPSLLAMLATAFGAVYPESLPPDDWRAKAIGTGPFMLKEFQHDRFLGVIKNPDYWVRGRPYLDGIRYNIIPARASRIAAYRNREIEIDAPSETTRPFMEALKAAVPEVEYVATARTSFSNVVFNTKRPPFDEPKLRQVLSMALDRRAFAKAVFQGGMIPGGIMLPAPAGVWGLPPEKLGNLPGYGDIEQNRAAARKIMAALGYSAAKPLKTKLATRTLVSQVDSAIWTASELKHVWIDAEVQQLETTQFYAAHARRDFTISLHSVAIAADDPDVGFYEHYGCHSQRNYSDYCPPEVQQMFDAQSALVDAKQRTELVHKIEERMIDDLPRVIYGYVIRYNARQPYVKNYVPHQTTYNYSRMQEVWLDR